MTKPPRIIRLCPSAVQKHDWQPPEELEPQCSLAVCACSCSTLQSCTLLRSPSSRRDAVSASTEGACLPHVSVAQETPAAISRCPHDALAKTWECTWLHPLATSQSLDTLATTLPPRCFSDWYLLRSKESSIELVGILTRAASTHEERHRSWSRLPSSQNANHDAVRWTDRQTIWKHSKIHETRLQCHLTKTSAKLQNSLPGARHNDSNCTPWQPSRSEKPFSVELDCLDSIGLQQRRFLPLPTIAAILLGVYLASSAISVNTSSLAAIVLQIACARSCAVSFTSTATKASMQLGSSTTLFLHGNISHMAKKTRQATCRAVTPVPNDLISLKMLTRNCFPLQDGQCHGR